MSLCLTVLGGWWVVHVGASRGQKELGCKCRWVGGWRLVADGWWLVTVCDRCLDASEGRWLVGAMFCGRLSVGSRC